MRLLALLVALGASPALSHELWIAPIEHQVGADSRVLANLVNGENFAGTGLPYLPRNFERFVVVSGDTFTNVEGRIGDTPALDIAPLGDGLHVAAYITTPRSISYETWEKFQKFVDHKDLGDARSQHDARGLPDVDFKEAYFRFSKALISVGSGAGDDRFLGMETEIVALDNPYTSTSSTMRLQLYYQREVRANEQVEIFEKSPDGSVNVFLLQTDDQGVVSVPVKSGNRYMADAVVLREPSAVLAQNTGAVWETLWANITWAQP